MPPYEAYSPNLPITEEISACGICLPSYFGMKDTEIKTISELLLTFLSENE